MVAPPSEHAPSSLDSQSAKSQESSLKKEVEQLREEVKNINREKSGFWKKIAMVLGILGGLFAIPNSAVTGYGVLVSHPKTEIAPKEALAVFYNPSRAVFVAMVPILVANKGNADDELNDADVIVGYVPDSSSSATSEETRPAQGAMTFSDKGSLQELGFASESQIHLPIAIVKKVSRIIYCSIEVDRQFFARPGKNSLEVGLFGTGGKRYPVKVCFNLNERQILELETKHAATGKRWYDFKCTQALN
jgi:hypothetical protein